MLVEVEEEVVGDGDGIEDKSSGASVVAKASVEGWWSDAAPASGTVRLLGVSVAVAEVVVEGQVLQVCGQST